jgi:hypothetical protein
MARQKKPPRAMAGRLKGVGSGCASLTEIQVKSPNEDVK